MEMQGILQENAAVDEADYALSPVEAGNEPLQGPVE